MGCGRDFGLVVRRKVPGGWEGGGGSFGSFVGYKF